MASICARESLFSGDALEVYLYDGLAAVHELVARVNAVGIERWHCSHGLTARRFDLHHLGAHVSEMQCRLRPWNELAEVENADTREEIDDLHGPGCSTGVNRHCIIRAQYTRGNDLVPWITVPARSTCNC